MVPVFVVVESHELLLFGRREAGDMRGGLDRQNFLVYRLDDRWDVVVDDEAPDRRIGGCQNR